MSRSLTSPVRAAFLGEHVRYLEFYELDFPSGYLRLCNATHTVSWNGYDWLGAGLVGVRSGMEESGGFSAPSVTLQIAAVDPTIIGVALAENVRNRDARIWIAPLDENNVPLADPAGPWRYRIDAMPMQLGADQSVIGLTLVTREEDWDRALIRRYNQADQQLEYPDDRGFEYVEQMASREISWGPVPAPRPTAGHVSPERVKGKGRAQW